MKLEELEQLKGRIERLENEVFGMTFQEAETAIKSYLEVKRAKPKTEANHLVLKAAKMLGA